MWNQRDGFRREAEVSGPDAAEGVREWELVRGLWGELKQVFVDFEERSFQGRMKGAELSAWGRGPHGREGEAVDRGSPFQERRGEGGRLLERMHSWAGVDLRDCF